MLNFFVDRSPLAVTGWPLLIKFCSLIYHLKPSVKRYAPAFRFTP
jgi:hypothetical protein